MTRPKEFNSDNVLEKAMHTFWQKGYEATSMEDLLTVMEISRSSFYDTFGSKRQLFLSVLDRYCAGFIVEKFSLLDQSGAALPTLRRFVRLMLEGGLADPQRRGCLIANTVMELAPHEKDIAGKVCMGLKMGEDAFFKILVRAKTQGELSNDKDPRALARFLITMMQGTTVMIKAGMPANVVKQTADTAMSVLD